MTTSLRLVFISSIIFILLSLAGCRLSTEETALAPSEDTGDVLAATQETADVAELSGEAVPSQSAASNGQANYFIPKPAAAKVNAGDMESLEPPEPEAEDQQDEESAEPSDSETENPQADNSTEPAVDEMSVTPPVVAVPADPHSLIITGDGVSKETAFTLSQLKSLRDGFRETTFSTTNNWPRYRHVSVEGISLTYLLRQAGLSGNASSFRLVGSDGNYVVITYNQMFGESYSYINHSADGSTGPIAVEPVIAWSWTENGNAAGGSLRSFFGQKGPLEVNTTASISNLCLIEVSTSATGSWTAPASSIDSGATVKRGTQLELKHNKLDQVRIYYTLDGSEPDYNSHCYNPSASYLQPQMLQPLELWENVTIKAFASAYGMERSPVSTFYYTVE